LSNHPSVAQNPKITLRNIGGEFQQEAIRDGKAYHFNYVFQDCFDFIFKTLESGYRQLNCRDSAKEYLLKISKKGRISLSERPISDPLPGEQQHDRKKNYLIREGAFNPLLADMGIMTKDGKIVNAKYDKFRQINRYLEIISDGIKKLDTTKEISIVDFGCGKSYLTFVLYHYLTDVLNFNVKVVGVDAEQDIIEGCRKTAQKYHFDKLHFLCSGIEDYVPSGPVDIVVSLHACDTATDYALDFAVKNEVKLLFAVPCCQHEINSQMTGLNKTLFTRHGLLKERYAALITDAVRANILEYRGYRTQVLEFVDFENTAKNVMIRAVKASIPIKARQVALSEVKELVGELGVSPAIYRLLVMSNKL